MGQVRQASHQPRTAPYARWMSETNDITRVFLAAGQIPGLINIAGGLPDPSTFMAKEIAAIAEKVIKGFPEQTVGYGPIEGQRELRELVAQRFSRGTLRLSAENVLIITSGMQGLDLMGKVMLDPGDLIAGQFPTYLGALDAWRPRHPIYRNMELHAEGFDPLAEMAGAKFAYVVPNFSNPTGRLVGEPTRQKLSDGAVQTGAWLLEDDPYGTLNYGDPLPPSILEISSRTSSDGDYDGQVVYLGSMSKQASPGLRVGWAIASKDMVKALTLAKQGSDMCTSGVTQLIALEILQSDLIDVNQPKVVELYRGRRDALCAAMSEHLSDWYEWEVPVGGMFVWAMARDPGFSSDRLLNYAMEEKVCISPSSVFDSQGEYRQAIRINFTLNNEEKLIEATRRLARATQRMIEEGR